MSPRYRYLEDGGVCSLMVPEASPLEAGIYTCRASNTHGHRETQAYLQVVRGLERGKPAMFLSRPETSMTVAVGEDISISFRVTGEPRPKSKPDLHMDMNNV